MSSTAAVKYPVRSALISALGLGESATAFGIYAILESAPALSAADYLHRGLTDEYFTGAYLNGRRQYETPAQFAALTDADEIEEALIAALDRGSELINEAFRAAIDQDVVDRNLVNYLGETPRPTPPDGFGDSFNLLENIKSQPFKPPFAEDLVKELNGLWGLRPGP